MKQPDRIELPQALNELRESGKEFISLFENPLLSVELYQPHLIDQQQPHDRDECYIIAKGEANFFFVDKVSRVKAGDFLYVPANAKHRFLDFSKDFAVWVFFIGPVADLDPGK